jgi:polyisoprenoid-binding protein YceI
MESEAMLRRTLAATSCLLLVLPALATAAVEKFNVDPGHSEVGFAVRHFVSKTPGRFNQFEGTVMVDPADPSTLSIDGKVAAASIDTNNEKRDGHLKSADFLDVEKHPDILFKSKKVAKAGDKWKVTGDLTLHGVTKEITLDLAPPMFGPDSWGNTRAGFEATGKIDRKAFGIVWNKALDQGGTMLGDDVDVTIRVEAVKDKGDAAAAAKR